MKTPNKDLFDLIKSLSDVESRDYIKYSKKYGKSPNFDYLQLFNVYRKMQEFDENTAKDKINLLHFKRTKNYLHNNILQFLATRRTLNSEREIMNLIVVSDVLIEKRLLNQSLKLLWNIRKKSFEKEFYHLTLLIDERIFNVESNVLSQNFFNYILNDYQSKEFNPIIQKLEIEEEFRRGILKRRVFSEMYNANPRDRSNFKVLEEWLGPFVNKGADYPNSFKSKNNYFIICAYYYQIKGEVAKAIDYFEKAALHAQTMNPEPNGAVAYHLIGIHNLLFVYSQNKLQEKMRIHLDEMQKLKLPNRTFKYMMLRSYCIYEADYCRHLFSYPQRRKKLQYIENNLQEHFKNAPSFQLHLVYLHLSTAYFCDMNFRKALQIILKCEAEKDFDQLKEFAGVIKLYKLILYYELDKTDLLPFAFRNTYRYLLKQSVYTKFEGIVMKTLRLLSSTHSNKVQNNYLKEALRELTILREDNIEKKPFSLFDFAGWIKCRIDRKNYNNLFRELN